LDFSKTIIEVSEKERIKITEQVLITYLNQLNSTKNDR